MKNRVTKIIVLITGILAYSFFYIATTKVDSCPERYTYQKDSIIITELNRQPGYLYHSFSGKKCDSLLVQCNDSTTDFIAFADSACIAAKKAQIIVKGTIICRWNSGTMKLDTLARRSCQ